MAYKEKNISEWDRKAVINDLLAELKTKLFKLPAGQWFDALKIIDRNIQKKNILIYFNNSDQQALIKNLGADGAIASGTGDYLMVVDANLAAFKTDAVVKKDLAYSLRPTDSNWQATVKLSYDHQGGFDWRTTRYRSYTRVYAPLGSVLEKIEGIEKDKNDFNASDDLLLKKTVFGFFFQVEPGDSREITIQYRLPGTLFSGRAGSSYQLLIQKQPGRRTNSLDVNLTFDKVVADSSPAAAGHSAKSLNFQTDLEQDRNFIVNFQ
jgi:hypothetical protein